MNVKFQCKMDLSNYPQDVQWCPVDIASLTRTNKSISLQWSHFSTSMADDNPKFRIRSTEMSYCSQTNHLGTYSCLKASIKLVRRVSYYVIRIYSPTFVTTISSFTGFWIPVLAWPARVNNKLVNSILKFSYLFMSPEHVSFLVYHYFISSLSFHGFDELKIPLTLSYLTMQCHHQSQIIFTLENNLIRFKYNSIQAHLLLSFYPSTFHLHFT